MGSEYQPSLVRRFLAFPFLVLLLVSSLNAVLLWRQMCIRWKEGTGDIHNRLPGTFEDAAMGLEHKRISVLNNTPDNQLTWKMLGHGGFIRLGEAGELSFDVSMHHQLHCLNQIRTSYITQLERINAMPLNSTSPAAQSSDQATSGSRDPVGHANHCFQYLAQALLCRADSSLVPTSGHRPEDADQHLYRCRNWSSVREVVLRNRAKWKGVPYTIQ